MELFRLAILVNSFEQQRVLNLCLKGACFAGFEFNLWFSLYFVRDNEVELYGKSASRDFLLEISDIWWFDDECEWEKRVLSEGEGAQPDEPVKAFELAKFRWSGGGDVESVIVREQITIIQFVGGRTINIRTTEDDEHSYALYDNTFSEISSKWSLKVDSDLTYLLVPD